MSGEQVLALFFSYIPNWIICVLFHRIHAGLVVLAHTEWSWHTENVIREGLFLRTPDCDARCSKASLM